MTPSKPLRWLSTSYSGILSLSTRTANFTSLQNNDIYSWLHQCVTHVNHDQVYMQVYHLISRVIQETHPFICRLSCLVTKCNFFCYYWVNFYMPFMHRSSTKWIYLYNLYLKWKSYANYEEFYFLLIYFLFSRRGKTELKHLHQQLFRVHWKVPPPPMF